MTGPRQPSPYCKLACNISVMAQYKTTDLITLHSILPSTVLVEL